MHRREPPRPDPPPPGGPTPGPSYAPETLLIAGTTPGDDDDKVRNVVLGLPDGAGQLRRVGVCNGSGTVYREVTLHGPVQLLYLCAGMNALGFRQHPPEPRGFSKYSVLFARDRAGRGPLHSGP